MNTVGLLLSLSNSIFGRRQKKIFAHMALSSSEHVHVVHVGLSVAQDGRVRVRLTTPSTMNTPVSPAALATPLAASHDNHVAAGSAISTVHSVRTATLTLPGDQPLPLEAVSPPPPLQLSPLSEARPRANANTSPAIKAPRSRRLRFDSRGSEAASPIAMPAENS